ncbi:hypothetical protein [Hyphomonas sp.]|uniref:hypothetical protein n=1 Tax=Hyphomonas sp. TaxID=87 RepID=UPI0025C5BDE0|nr:hypothetical protein [Hyphomonas sp.]
MDLIIFNDGLYQLVPVTEKMLKDVVILQDLSCFDLCDILRLKLTTYVESINIHMMNNSNSNFIGCIC